MKKTLLLLFAISLLISFNAAAQIPNSGFENWNPFASFSDDGDPVGWTANNSFPDGFRVVQPTTPPYAGTNAAMLTSFDDGFYQTTFVGALSAEFVYTLRPAFLNGYMKATVQNGDSLFIGVALKKTGTVFAGGGQYFLSNVANWTPFSIPIAYGGGILYPDSAIILMKAGMTVGDPFDDVHRPGDTLIVDDLSFDFDTRINEFEKESSLNISPNPVSSHANISFYSNVTDQYNLIIMDMTGRTVQNKIISVVIGINRHELDLSKLAKGIYIASVRGAVDEQRAKVVVE